ncbi:MAG: thioredoxin-disulfide reductase [Synergistaceae bacterium]|nr:thioredoxin-disulfide reductase [Synergistaceae bacterium]
MKIAIIGSGPAGMTAAIYAARAGLRPLIVAGDSPGGQLINTDSVENYPGFERISGVDLMMNMMRQAEKAGATIVYDKVVGIDWISGGPFKLPLSSGDNIESCSTLIATGARHKYIGCEGESLFSNRGVSWCATCDGPMYRGKNVAVIGGGNTAVMEAVFLANFTNKVFMIHRRDSLRADNFAQKKVFNNDKIELIWNSEVLRISGSKSVENIEIKNRLDGSITSLDVAGVFIAVGTEPVSDLVKNVVCLDEDGYIVAKNTLTSVPGIFAAGDIVSGSLRQAISAAGQGAVASRQIEEFLGTR